MRRDHESHKLMEFVHVCHYLFIMLISSLALSAVGVEVTLTQSHPFKICSPKEHSIALSINQTSSLATNEFHLGYYRLVAG